MTPKASFPFSLVYMRVVGEYHALWVLLKVSLKDLEGLDEWEVQLPLPLATEDGDALVWVELGRQHDCGPDWSSLLRGSFFEAKTSLPFAKHSSGEVPLLSLKPIVIMDNYLNTVGSQRLHSLPTTYSTDFEFTPSHYTLSLGPERGVRLDYTVCDILCCREGV